jgi:iron complex outermembrane recepter protein
MKNKVTLMMKFDSFCLVAIQKRVKTFAYFYFSKNIIRFIFSYSILFYFFFSLSIFPQSQEPKTETIEIIGVKTSSGTDAEKQDKTGFHSTIKLDDSKDRYDMLPQVLEREAGLRVRQFGGLGSYSTLSIRGSNPNQSRYYIDGIPFHNSQSGEVNLADLPFDNIEEVEVYRSGVPVGFSGSAIGGIVNLKTIKPKKDRTRIQVAGGSFQTGRISATHTGLSKDKEIGYTLFGIGEKSDQNFSFLNDKGTIFNTIDDEINRRKNSQFQRAQGMGNMFWNAFQTDFRLLFDLNQREHGITGPGNNQTEKSKRKYTRLLSALNTDTKAFYWENLQMESRVFLSGFRDEIFDPRSEFSAGRPNSKTNSDNKGFQLTPTIFLLEYYQIIKISLGVEWEDFRRDRRNADHRVLEKEPIRNRRFRNIQIQDEIRFFESKLIVVPAIKWEEYYDTWENDFNPSLIEGYVQKRSRFTNPRIGLLWKAYEKSKHRFHLQANGSREVRIPAFLELFGERGQIIGNPNLKPERGKNLDFGFVYKGKYHDFVINSSASIFQKEIQDMILFIPNSQFSLRADNVDSARIDGLEISNALTWKEWKLVNNYTYSRAINTSLNPSLKGKYLPLRPLHEFFSSLSYQYGNWNIGIDYTFIGAVFRDRTNEYINYLPQRDIYGTFLTYALWTKETQPLNENKKGTIQEQLKFHFEMKNIGDKQFADFVGYPLPGRMWYAGLSYVF